MALGAQRAGALIANVRRIAEGDRIVVAWRHSSGVRTAYLRCRVATPLSPLEPGLVIDRLGEPDATVLTFAGYPQNSDGEVEGIRLDDIVERCFQVQGEYGGQNAIHRLAAQELACFPVQPHCHRKHFGNVWMSRIRSRPRRFLLLLRLQPRQVRIKIEISAAPTNELLPTPNAFRTEIG